MKEYKPYCYLIGWKIINKWYYGVEYGSRTKIANPNNLWKSYFTSSNHVKKFILENGQPDVIEIRKIFNTETEAIHWEHRVLQKMNVKNNDKWLNKNEGKAPVGIPWPAHRKLERSINVSGAANPMYGKTHSVQTKLLISERSKKTGIENGMYGKNHTTESKDKMSKNHKYLSGKDNHWFGKTHSVESIQKMSQSHNPIIHTFYHADYGPNNLTTKDLCKKFTILKRSGVKALVSGRVKSYMSWILYKE